MYYLFRVLTFLEDLFTVLFFIMFLGCTNPQNLYFPLTFQTLVFYQIKPKIVFLTYSKKPKPVVLNHSKIIVPTLKSLNGEI